MATNYLSQASADGQNMRLWKSKIAETPEAGTYPMIQIPRNAFIKDIWFYVLVAGSSDTITLGYNGNALTADTDYFMKTAETAATIAGLQRATTFPGMWFTDGAGQITMTVGTTQTTGSFIVLAAYDVIY